MTPARGMRCSECGGPWARCACLRNETVRQEFRNEFVCYLNDALNRHGRVLPVEAHPHTARLARELLAGTDYHDVVIHPRSDHDPDLFVILVPKS